MILGLTVLSALVAASQALDSVRPPERLVRSYDVVCRGRTGSVVIEERSDRSPPYLTVTLRSVTPLGASNPVQPSAELAAIFSRMARIQRLEWLCERPNAVLVIHYAEAQSIGRGYGRSITSGRAYLLLDERGLAPEPQPAEAAPRR